MKIFKYNLNPIRNKVILTKGGFEIYTNADLKTMQGWSLERKIRVSQLKIAEWYEHYEGNVAVSFSGGVDSTVLLDLARRAYPDIKAVFVNTTFEFPEIIKFVKHFDNVNIVSPKTNYAKVIDKYGYPIISKEIANYLYRMMTYDGCKEAYHNGIHLRQTEWIRENFSSIPFSFLKCMFGFNHKNTDIFIKTGIMPKSKYCIPQKWQYLIDAPFSINDRCCYHLKKAPIKKYTKMTGAKMYVGTLAQESVLRKQVWLNQGCNAFDATEPKSSPLSFWTTQDILNYLRLTRIPYCELYGNMVESNNGLFRFSGYQRTGCMGCLYGCHLEKEPNRLQMLKISHPKVYDYLFDKLNYKTVCDYIEIKY